MKILLVNDDGINAPGILKAEEILKKYGEVFVCAPKTAQSGKSSSITIFFGCDVEEIDSHHYAIDGTPVDCVEFAITSISNSFDLVVSGCNFGFNLAQDILYSGTCGACFKALLLKNKAISLSHPFKEDFSDLDVMFPYVLDYIFKNDLLSKEYFLNVNFPEIITNNIKITKLRDDIKEALYIKERNGTHIVTGRKFLNDDNDITYDREACANGYISITPISLNSFKEKYFNEVMEKLG